jgi:8-oxo-dGTP pyrophosphatase MutT (NUDIX family)
MEKTRDGVIGVLTHKDKVVFVSLPEEDVTTKDNGGKEKKERSKGSDDWTVLSTGMLGLVSGGVKEEELIEDMDYGERELIVFDTLRREAREEFDLDLDLTAADIMKDGIIEQLRRDEAITFLLWVVGRVIIGEEELDKLMEQAKVVLVEESKLKEFLDEEGDRVRPAAVQAIKTMYNL